MSIIYDALKKVELKITPAGQQGNAAASKFPIKALLLVVGVFFLGLLIGKLIFTVLLSPTSIRASLPVPAPVKVKPVEKAPQAAAPQAAAPLPANAPQAPAEPVITPEKQKEGPAFVLSGIFSSGEGDYALVNNQIVQQGDTVDGAKVTSISIDEVELEAEGQTIKLRAGKGMGGR